MNHSTTPNDSVWVLVFVFFLFFLTLFTVGKQAGVAAARATCLEHPTWHYDGPGTLSAATCKPPESES